MLFYLIRHGDPIYDPDSLTDLGHRQAEAAARRLCLHGLDKIYVSSSERAKQTAQPTCEILKLQPTELPWCHESRAWEFFSVPSNDCERTWLFYAGAFRDAVFSAEGRRDDWYNAPAFAGYPFREGVEYYRHHALDLMRELGFDYDEAVGQYKVLPQPYERVALFAHHGFGIAFLSTLLNLPYPLAGTRFDMNHSGITVLQWDDNRDYCFPRIITLSDCGHLYADGLPTKMCNAFYY